MLWTRSRNMKKGERRENTGGMMKEGMIIIFIPVVLFFVYGARRYFLSCQHQRQPLA